MRVDAAGAREGEVELEALLDGSMPAEAALAGLRALLAPGRHERLSAEQLDEVLRAARACAPQPFHTALAVGKLRVFRGVALQPAASDETLRSVLRESLAAWKHAVNQDAASAALDALVEVARSATVCTATLSDTARAAWYVAMAGRDAATLRRSLGILQALAARRGCLAESSDLPLDILDGVASAVENSAVDGAVALRSLEVFDNVLAGSAWTRTLLTVAAHALRCVARSRGADLPKQARVFDTVVGILESPRLGTSPDMLDAALAMCGTLPASVIDAADGASYDAFLDLVLARVAGGRSPLLPQTVLRKLVARRGLRGPQLARIVAVSARAAGRLRGYQGEEALATLGDVAASPGATVEVLGAVVDAVERLTADCCAQVGSKIAGLVMRRATGGAIAGRGFEEASLVARSFTLARRLNSSAPAAPEEWECRIVLARLAEAPLPIQAAWPALRLLPADVASAIADYARDGRAAESYAAAVRSCASGGASGESGRAVATAVFAAICAPVTEVSAEAAAGFVRMARREVGLWSSLSAFDIDHVADCLAARPMLAGELVALDAQARAILDIVDGVVPLRSPWRRARMAPGVRTLCRALGRVVRFVDEGHGRLSERLRKSCGGSPGPASGPLGFGIADFGSRVLRGALARA